MAKSDDGLVTIKKPGERTLRIHPDALPQHVNLGWQECEPEPEAKSEPETKQKKGEKGEKDGEQK